MESKKVLIICVVIVAIVLACAAAFCYVSMNEVKYTNQNFDGFSMNVPRGSDFEKVNLKAYGLESSYSVGAGILKMVAYRNKGNFSNNISGVFFIDLPSSNEDYSISVGTDFQTDALFDYLFMSNTNSFNEGEFIVNGSNRAIIKSNSTNDVYMGIIFDGNPEYAKGVAILGGNDLDIVKNATYSFKFN